MNNSKLRTILFIILIISAMNSQALDSSNKNILSSVTDRIVKLPTDIILKGNEGGNGGNLYEQKAYRLLNIAYKAMKSYYVDQYMQHSHSISKQDLESLKSILLSFVNLNKINIKIENTTRNSRITNEYLILQKTQIKILSRHNKDSKKHFCSALELVKFVFPNSKAKLSCDLLYPYHQITNHNYLIDDSEIIKICKEENKNNCLWDKANYKSLEKTLSKETAYSILGDLSGALYHCSRKNVALKTIKAKSLPEAYRKYLVQEAKTCNKQKSQGPDNIYKAQMDISRLHKNSAQCNIHSSNPMLKYYPEFNLIRKSLVKAIDVNKEFLSEAFGSEAFNKLQNILNIDPKTNTKLKLALTENIIIGGSEKDFQNISSPDGHFVLKYKAKVFKEKALYFNLIKILYHEYLGFAGLERNQYNISSNGDKILEDALKFLNISDPEQILADRFYEASRCGLSKKTGQALADAIKDFPQYHEKINCIFQSLAEQSQMSLTYCSKDTEHNPVFNQIKKLKSDNNEPTNCMSSAMDRAINLSANMGLVDYRCKLK